MFTRTGFTQQTDDVVVALEHGMPFGRVLENLGKFNAHVADGEVGGEKFLDHFAGSDEIDEAEERHFDDEFARDID